MTTENPIANLRELLSQLERSRPKNVADLQQTATDAPDEWLQQLNTLTEQCTDQVNHVEKAVHATMVPIRGLTALLRHVHGLNHEYAPNNEVMQGFYFLCDHLYEYIHALHRELDTSAWPDPSKSAPSQPGLNV